MLPGHLALPLRALIERPAVERTFGPLNIIANPGATKLIDFGIATRHRDREGAAGASPRREVEDAGRTGARRVSLVDLLAETLGADLSVLGDSGPITVEAAPFGLPSGTVGYIERARIAEGLPATPASDIEIDRAAPGPQLPPDPAG